MAKKTAAKEKAGKTEKSELFQKMVKAGKEMDQNYDLGGLVLGDIEDETELKEAFKDRENSIPADDEALSDATWEVMENLEMENAAQRKELKSKKADKKADKKSADKKAAKEEDEESEPEKPTKKGAKPEKKADVKGKRKGPPTKGPGVINSIIPILKKAPKIGLTKVEIAKKLKEEFPEREEKSVLGTVSAQLGGRLQKEKGVEIMKPSKDHYRIA